jgi:hypothetical protein
MAKRAQSKAKKAAPKSRKKVQKKSPIKAPRVRKVTEAQFWDAVRRAMGYQTRAARLIEAELGISYTRQAVKDRINKNPEKYQEILESFEEQAEEVMVSCMMQSKDLRVKRQAAKDILTRPGGKWYEGNQNQQQGTSRRTLQIIPILYDPDATGDQAEDGRPSRKAVEGSRLSESASHQ